MESVDVAQTLQVDLGSTSDVTMLSTIRDTRRHLEACRKNLAERKNKSHQELVLEEWRLVALVADRFLFWTALIITIILTPEYVNRS